MKKNILIVVGGTGGHIYPGLALAAELKKRMSATTINFITDGRSLAKEVIEDKGYATRNINAAPLPRKKFWHICCFIIKSFVGFVESIFFLRSKKPNLIVAFGSYISVPVVLASSVMRVPVILHEQNYFPGMANRFLAFWADKIALTFKATAKYFPSGKIEVTGNPVREDILDYSRDKGIKEFNLDKNRITILVFGGSQGAEDINYSVGGLLPYLEGLKKKIQFIHICGPRGNYKNLIRIYSEAGIMARVFVYLKDMAPAYGAADIVVCRAGATTIAEVSSKGIPAIFIPYPYATSRHQQLNTVPVCDIEGGICLSNGEVSGELLALNLIPLLKDSELRKRMQIKLKPLKKIFSGAATQLADMAGKYV